MPPYSERQRGDACRVHALNALFGRPVIDEARLGEWAREFDAHYGYHVTDQFDCVQSDSLTLVSFILETRCKYVTHYVPLHRPPSPLDLAPLLDPHVPAVLLFNANHIWCVRRWDEGDGQWYNLDSLMGRPQRLFQPPLLPAQTGAILLFTPSHAHRVLLPKYQREVCTYVRTHALNTTDAVQQWASSAQSSRELGSLETSLCNFMRVYMTTRSAEPEVVQKYRELLKQLGPSLRTSMWTLVLPLLTFAVRFEYTPEILVTTRPPGTA